MRNMIRYFFSRITAGFVIFLPIAIILFLLAKVIAALSVVSEQVAASIPREHLGALPVVTLLSVLGLVLIVFLLGTIVAPRSRHSSGIWVERKFLNFVPGYSLVKGTLVGAFGVETEGGPKAGVLRRWPGVEELVLILQELEDGRTVVFLPNAPSPSSGRLLVVRDAAVEPIQASIAAVMRVFTDWGMGAGRVLPAAEKNRETTVLQAVEPATSKETSE